MSKSHSNAVKAELEGGGASAVQAVAQPSGVFDDRGRTVPWMTRTLYRLYDAEAQKVLDKENVSLSHWFYLRVLAERGEINQLELSKRVGMASTTAVPALDNMEKRGLVRRTRDPKDRRKYYVSLQDKGRRLVEALLPELTDMIAASREGISQKDMRTVWKVMHQIERNLNRASEDDSVVD
ncbi:MarR family transcriptional regulator [Paraburkholderia sp. CNPSo 3155]|uniref:MarR family transcriptional regulator for hemolysin n=1 Tax=Paraburkholderia atlantica TaxID=2654982 RepID=A0A6I1Q2U7_PARAM|nr:MarR family transcriptional regulator [Paraburkholderia atlantica]MBB5423130.1 MarR family transcriptional regulator for hemolysin [Paraburkholderia atlantica]MPW08645.1 MarR family transcriptional regulator [Paraburkholderia atlantica]